MKNFLIISGLLIISFNALCQDTTYYNKDWNKVKKRKNPSYYRVKKYIRKTKVYYVEDFYITGNKQMTGTFKSLDPDVKYGYFMWWYPNGQISKKGTYIENNKEGTFYNWDSLGNLISEIDYSKGQYNGLYCDWYKNGQLKDSYNYSFNKQNGLYKSWYKNGQLKDSINYLYDKLNGVVVSFYNNGNILRNDLYMNDSLVKGACFTKNGNDTTYFPYIEKADFVRGLNGFRNYVQLKLYYPEDALRRGLQGIVYISFVVDTTGKVVNAKVVNSSNEIFNTSALQAVESSPKWKPGKKNGKLVEMSFTIPVIYMFK